MKLKFKKYVNLIFKACFGFILFIHPLILYGISYDIQDCDDKAAHYFSSLYTFSSSQQQSQIDQILNQANQTQQDSRFVSRTNFRLQSVKNYPLANIAIKQFSSSSKYYSISVKQGLFLVTLVGYLIFFSLSLNSIISVWWILITINFIAIVPRVIELPIIDSIFARNMIPFLTYVPRGIAALAIIPLVITYSNKKIKLFLLTLCTIFLFHASFGALLLGIIMPTTIVHIFLKKTYLQNVSLKNCSTQLIRAITYNTIFLLASMVAVISITYILKYYPSSADLWGHLKEPAIKEIPQRLSGIQWTSLIFEFTLAALVLKGTILSSFHKPERPLLMLAVIILCFFIFKNSHRYIWQLTGNNTYFHTECREVPLRELPQQASQLDFFQQATLFYSLGYYLQDP